MAYSELVSYITDQTQQGIPAEVLRQSLMESGWQEREISNAFHDVVAGLSPLTEGASLHEDVSQVRSMVSHLASRVKAIEATLASTGGLPTEAMLPNGTIGPDHELSAPQPSSRWLAYAPLLIAGVVFGGISKFATSLMESTSLAPRDQATLVIAVAAVLFIGGFVTLRMHRARVASVLTGVSLALWSLVTWISWKNYHVMEWSTAAALAVFFVVLAWVLGRWAHRMARS